MLKSFYQSILKLFERFKYGVNFSKIKNVTIPYEINVELVDVLTYFFEYTSIDKASKNYTIVI